MGNKNTDSSNDTPSPTISTPSSITTTKSYNDHVTTMNIKNKKNNNSQPTPILTTPPTTKSEKNKMRSTNKIENIVTKLNRDMKFENSIWI